MFLGAELAGIIYWHWLNDRAVRPPIITRAISIDVVNMVNSFLEVRYGYQG